MSDTYIALRDEDIEAGKPTKEEIFKRIQENQDCFNTDIELLKQTAGLDIFNIKFAGNIGQYSLQEVSQRVPVYRANLAATITQFRIALLSSSTSGIIQVELERSTDEGANWSGLLLSPVELTGVIPGSVSGNVNFISPASQEFNQNDLLRIRIIGLQLDQGEFHIAVSGELA